MAVVAVAVAVVAVLLLGGRGSFAYWASAKTVPGGPALTSGALTFTANPGCGSWTFSQTGGLTTWNGTAYPAGSTTTTGTQYVEPNDKLTTNCTYALTATGDHMQVKLGMVQPTVTVASGTVPGVTATVTYTVNGMQVAAGTTITATTNAVVTGVVTLTVPNTISSTSPSGGFEGTSFTVTGAALTATQVHP